MRNKLLSSVLFLLVSNIFAADIVAPDPKILTGDDLASTALWRGLHHNNDSLRKSMNDNIKAYAAAYIPEIYSKSNQNEVRLSQYTGDIINVIADQVNAVQDSNQIFIIEKEISVGEYNLNTGTFSATVPLVIYLPTNYALTSLVHTLDIKYQNKITLKLDGQEDDDNKYLKKNLRMPKSEALKYIDKYPNRTICVEYIVKDIQVNEPERKGIFGATDFIFAADIINYSFTRGPCA